MKALSLLICLILISCGKSPLLDHDHETENVTPGSKSVETKKIESYFGFKTQGITITRLWIHGPFPSSDSESSVLLILRDEKGDLVDLPEQYEIVAEGWMDNMGHGTADDGYVEKTGLGNYLHKELYFNMGGLWSYNLYLYDGEDLIDQTSYKFEF